MRNFTLFIGLFASCVFYLAGCSTEESIEAPQQENLAPKMISSRQADAGMLAQIGISKSSPNARMVQTFKEEAALVATYEGTEGIEYLFIPYEENPAKQGVFIFHKGEYFKFNADLEIVNNQVARLITKAGIATYTRDEHALVNVSFERAKVKTADEIKQMRMDQREDSAMQYYIDCMDAIATQASWYCGGCATGKVMFGIGCAAFEPCAVGSVVTCAGLAVLDYFR